MGKAAEVELCSFLIREYKGLPGLMAEGDATTVEIRRKLLVYLEAENNLVDNAHMVLRPKPRHVIGMVVHRKR